MHTKLVLTYTNMKGYNVFNSLYMGKLWILTNIL